MNKILVFVNIRIAKTKNQVERVNKWCKKNKIKLEVIEHALAPREDNACESIYQWQTQKMHPDLAVILGGDGTLLRAATAFAPLGIPLLPIATGNVGFLIQHSTQNMLKALDYLHTHPEWKYDERVMLEACSESQRMKLQALNEFVITRPDTTRLKGFKIKINNMYVTDYRADALIISTATGSSGYNLSAYGPLIIPQLDNVVITPICAHPPMIRPLVASASDTIEIYPDADNNEPLVLVANGQTRKTLYRKRKLLIRKAPFTLKLIETPYGITFFESLRNKLGWK
ncbi:MAG TPA: NAD(+)/NADH kinase [bacterium]|nr:NAD(+)/NADH kinase [bacterium]